MASDSLYIGTEPRYAGVPPAKKINEQFTAIRVKRKTCVSINKTIARSQRYLKKDLSDSPNPRTQTIKSTRFMDFAQREKKKPSRAASDTLKKIYQILPTPHPDNQIYQIYGFRAAGEEKTIARSQRYLRKIYKILPTPHPDNQIYQIYGFRAAGEEKRPASAWLHCYGPRT